MNRRAAVAGIGALAVVVSTVSSCGGSSASGECGILIEEAEVKAGEFLDQSIEKFAGLNPKTPLTAEGLDCDSSGDWVSHQSSTATRPNCGDLVLTKDESGVEWKPVASSTSFKVWGAVIGGLSYELECEQGPGAGGRWQVAYTVSHQ